MQFQNTRLDIGSFLQDVLKPIADQVSGFIAPIKPLIDFVTSNVPLLDSLGLNVTWLDLAKTLGGANTGMIEAIAQIIDVISTIESVAGAGEVPLPIGTITIFQQAGPGGAFMPNLWDGGLDRNNVFNQISSASGLLDGLLGGDVSKGITDSNYRKSSRKF